MVYDGKPTRDWIQHEDMMSPTAALESIVLTALIDTNEQRDVRTCDIPNAFIQAEMPEVKQGQNRVMMKITGVLVDLLTKVDPSTFGPKVVFENKKRVI